jgi:hypothetical protein
VESKWGFHASLQTHALLFVQASAAHTNKDNKNILKSQLKIMGQKGSC